MLLTLLLIINLVIVGVFAFPVLLKVMRAPTNVAHVDSKYCHQADYAIVITVFKQTDLLNDLLCSIENLNYENYVVYVVMDNCRDFVPSYLRVNVRYLFPETILANNVKSHRYAIDRFVRNHDRITIIDSDNLVDPNYLLELNRAFDKKFMAVQGARRAKRIRSDYAKLDAVSDIYYRYVDRKLLFEAGSSSTLSGSGMAFDLELYKDFVNEYDREGAGFDKILQCKIVAQNHRIAFSNDVIVYDEKTVNSDQLVKQRGRWLSTWFKSIRYASSLFVDSLTKFNRNKFLFSVVLLRPPLFLMILLTAFLFILNLFIYPFLNLLLVLAVICFIYIFVLATRSFELSTNFFTVLKKAPGFIILQIFALRNVNKADKISIATEHIVQEKKETSRVKVLHTIRQGEVGGGEAHVLDLVQNLDKEKFQSFVLCFSYGPMVDKLKHLGVEVHVIETKRPFDFRIWNKVRDLIDLYNFDIIHAHGTRALSNSYYPSRKLGKKIIYTVHGWSFHRGQSRWIHFIRAKCERFLINKVNRTICVSQTGYDEGFEKLGNFCSTIITNGVNQVRFNPTNKFKNIRAELNISEDTFVLGFIGRLTKQKNPILLLESFCELPSDMNAKMLIVGNGDLRRETLLKAKELNLEGKVLFMDFRSDVEDILNAIDVYCLLSHWEGLSIGLLEAMAMKKAIIVSDVPGNTEVIKHLKNGVVVPMDARQVAKSMLYLYQNKVHAENISQNALNTVQRSFSIHEMTRKTEKIYHDLGELV